MIGKMPELLLGPRGWSYKFKEKINEIIEIVNNIDDPSSPSGLEHRVEVIEDDLDATKEGSLAAQVTSNTTNVGIIGATASGDHAEIGTEDTVGTILYRIKQLEDAPAPSGGNYFSAHFTANVDLTAISISCEEVVV